MMWLASILLLTIVVGLWRLWRGPEHCDRLLTVQLSGTGAVAILLLLAEAQSQPALLDAALILALLAAVGCVALVQLLRGSHDD